MDSKNTKWTKRLDNLPKFSILQITDYVRSYGKDRANDKGFEFYFDGYPHDVFVANKGTVFTAKAKCSRSLQASEKPHNLTVDLSADDGTVLGGRCSCKAGEGAVCNHIFSLLHLLSHWSLTSVKEIPIDKTCTSLPQQWHIPRGEKIRPEPVMKVTFVRSSTERQENWKRDPVHCTLYEARAMKGKSAPSEEEISKAKQQLQARNPSIPFSYLTSQSKCSEKATIFGNVPSTSILGYQLQDYVSKQFSFSYYNVPVPIDGNINAEPQRLPIKTAEIPPYDKPELNSYEMEFIANKLNCTLEEAQDIEATTVTQRLSSSWKENRMKRLTASHFGEVIIRKSKPSEAFIRNILSPKNISSLAAPMHGIEHEDRAKLIYIKKMKKQLKPNIQVYESGLIVNPTFPYLGASPDGKVVDKSVDEPYGLLEIKCPFKYRKKCPAAASDETDFFLEKCGDDRLRLKRDHIYFYQIQGLMAIAGLTWCDFVVYTLTGMHVERVNFNSTLLKDTMFPKLSDFYYKFGVQYVQSTCANS